MEASTIVPYLSLKLTSLGKFKHDHKGKLEFSHTKKSYNMERFCNGLKHQGLHLKFLTKMW
jgi:hypothetical protein